MSDSGLTRRAKQAVGRWLFPRLPITRRLFDELRFEANGFRVRWSYAVLPWWRRRLSRLRRLDGQLVNVACGPHVLPAFLNLDLLPASPGVVAWDCRRALPVADGAAAGVRIEQFLEHLDPREELPAFLRDVRRVLVPGGVLRIVVPDAERYLAAYVQGGREPFRALGVSDPWPVDLPTRLDVINHVFHQWHEHRWAYDFETLAHRLWAAGYSHVERTAFRRSLDPRLADDRPHHAPSSLYVDAVR